MCWSYNLNSGLQSLHSFRSTKLSPWSMPSGQVLRSQSCSQSAWGRRCPGRHSLMRRERERKPGISRGPKGWHWLSFHKEGRVEKSQVSEWSTDGVGRARDGPITERAKMKSITFSTSIFRTLDRLHQISPFSQLENVRGRWTLGFYKLLLKLVFIDLLLD